jgi:hypothetical protein
MTITNSNSQKAVEKPKVRDVAAHLNEIQSLFLERLAETKETPLTKGIKLVPQAFEVLTDNSLSEEERENIITSLGMALSDATENFLFEYLLSTGYYKDEEEFCQDGETSYGLIEDEGLPYIDMRLKSEMTIYVQLHARHFTDPDFATQDYHLMLKQFDAARKEKVVLQFCTLRDDIQNDITGLETQWEAAESTDQLDELRKERYESQLYVLRNIHKKLEEIINSYYGILPDDIVHPTPSKQLPTEREATVVVSFTSSVTLDVPAGSDEQTIKELAVEQFNSLDPEDRDMGPQHATVVDIDYTAASAKKKTVVRLSELTGKNERRDEVENFLFVHRNAEIIIDAGFYLEVYTNPDGVFEKEQTSNGASTFIQVDEDTTFGELLDLFEGEGRIRDQTLTIQVIPAEDESYARERGFAEENPISSLKKKGD